MKSVIGWVWQSQELETQGPHFNAEERIVYWKLRHLEKK